MILTPDQRLRVFVSSTLSELRGERQAARAAIESLKLIPVMFEAGARPHPPRTLYRSYLDQSDVFVGIYWQSYGWIAPDMEISGLEDEFKLSSKMPRLLYIKQADERDPGLDKMIGRLQQEASVSYKSFKTAPELEALIRDDLVLLLTERFHHTEVVEDTAPKLRSKLPAQTTSFIGRERELRNLFAHLCRDDVRLTTLTGPGGIGKTRLALEMGNRWTAIERAVYFIPLAPIRDPALVIEEIAKVLGVRRSGEANLMEAVTQALSSQPGLLILDNFEQVLDAASLVAELLNACPSLKILCTSRAPLRLTGEHEFYVPVLSLPGGEEAGESPLDSDAVQLFVQRAKAARSDFELTEANTPTIVEICRRLDGLPLAIELAAARIRLLTPELLLDKLDERLQLLAGGARDMPERHQRLRDTIAWSYDLLDEDAKTTFARLGAFRGGFTLEAAEAICGYDGLDVLNALSALIEQSLVRNGIAGAEPRFMMLETIREFATELLREGLDPESTLEQHARYYAELARLGGIAVRSGGSQSDLDRLEREIYNMRASASWLLRNGGADVVAEAIWESWWMWWTRGYLREGRLWAERTLERRDDMSPIGLARSLGVLGAMAFWQYDIGTAIPAFQEALEIFNKYKDERGSALCDLALGLMTALSGDLEEGQERIRGSLEAFLRANDRGGASMSAQALGWTHIIFETFEGHESDFQLALRLAKELNNEIDIALSESGIGWFYFKQGNESEGIRLMHKGLKDLGRLRHFASAMNVVDYAAEIALLRGRPEPALMLIGAAEAIRERIGTVIPFPLLERVAAHKREASEQLSNELAEKVLAEGRDLDFDSVISLALEVFDPVRV
jgi:predicted ATPase